MIPTETSMTDAEQQSPQGLSTEPESLNRESAVIRGLRFSLERGRTDSLFRSSLKSGKSAAAIPPALSDNRRVHAPSGNHSNGTGVIENGIDLTRGSDLNRALAFTVWNPNHPLGRARSADDRSRK